MTSNTNATSTRPRLGGMSRVPSCGASPPSPRRSTPSPPRSPPPGGAAAETAPASARREKQFKKFRYGSRPREATRNTRRLGQGRMCSALTGPDPSCLLAAPSILVLGDRPAADAGIRAGVRHGSGGGGGGWGGKRRRNGTGEWQGGREGGEEGLVSWPRGRRKKSVDLSPA